MHKKYELHLELVLDNIHHTIQLRSRGIYDIIYNQINELNQEANGIDSEHVDIPTQDRTKNENIPYVHFLSSTDVPLSLWYVISSSHSLCQEQGATQDQD